MRFPRRSTHGSGDSTTPPHIPQFHCINYKDLNFYFFQVYFCCFFLVFGTIPFLASFAEKDTVTPIQLLMSVFALFVTLFIYACMLRLCNNSGTLYTNVQCV